MKKSTKILVVSVLVLILTIVLTKGISYAKYVSNSVWNYYLETKEFYFSSDYLKTTSMDNVNKTWDGGRVNFNIRNSENSLISDYNINYKIVCTTNDPSVTCKVNNGSNIYNGVLTNEKKCINLIDSVDVSSYDKSTCEINGYEWKNIEAVKDLYFELESEIEINDIEVSISANSTSPYSKTLYGKFILKKDKSLNGSIDMKLNSYAEYDRLIISNNYNENKCVSISWDTTKLLIDTPVLDVISTNNNNGYINNIILEVSAKNNASFKFFKVDNLIHNISDFTLIETEC